MKILPGFIHVAGDADAQVVHIQGVGIVSLLGEGQHQADAQGILPGFGDIVNGVKGAAVIPETQHPVFLLMQQADGKIMLPVVHGKTMLNGVAGHFLDTQIDMIGDPDALAVAETEAFSGPGSRGHLRHGVNIQFQQI